MTTPFPAARPGGADPIAQRSPMSDTLPPVPPGSTIRKNADGSWSYRDGPHTWRPMAAPQTAAPWATPSTASIPTERLDAQSLAVQLMATIADSNRLGQAVCVASLPGSSPCKAPCNASRQSSAATAHVIGQILRERHGGSSTTADWLDGVGCHPRGGSQPVQQPSQICDGTTPRQRLAMARYNREFYLCFIRRVWQVASLRRRYKACQQQ
jgi:hypothetical protein